MSDPENFVPLPGPEPGIDINAILDRYRAEVADYIYGDWSAIFKAAAERERFGSGGG